MRHGRPATAALLGAFLLSTSCASVHFTRETESSGTFTASGLAITLFSIDVPKRALDIARENASDANLPNMEVNSAVVFPYLGWFDWILDIASVRYARVSGTWGFSNED